MRTWLADWRRWSPAERALAVALLVTMIMALPLGLLLTTRPGI